MLNNKISIIVLFFATAFFVSCELEELENLNSPTLESFEQDASQADVQSLAVGLEAVIRNDLEFHYETVSYLAREYYDLTGTDPRYTGEILKGPLDNNGFLTTRSYAAWYRTIKTANVLINSVQNSEAGFSNTVKDSYYGYANTMKAYALLMVANRQYTNGIRIDVANPDNLGTFVNYDDALVAIRDLLDTAYSQLNNNEENFNFPLTGFEDLREPSPTDASMNLPLSPSNFNKFNRAVAARVALYQNDYTQVLNLLEDSFLDINGAMFNGVIHDFGLTGNDIANNLFYTDAENFVVHDSWINDAEIGDTRVSNKSFLLVDEDGTPTPAIFDNLTASYHIALYENNTSSVYMIRNEELILMYAEANIGTDNTATVTAINIVRNAAGLSNYTDGTTDNELIEEVLNQRKYSLFGEGHRWIDLRRLNRLNDSYVPLDRDGDTILDAFPTPFSENVN